eukprot:3403236-Rhodomonas_salina.3
MSGPHLRVMGLPGGGAAAAGRDGVRAEGESRGLERGGARQDARRHVQVVQRPAHSVVQLVRALPSFQFAVERWRTKLQLRVRAVDAVRH